MVYLEVTAAELVKTISEISNNLIIDCRSFLVYNKGHVSGSLNIRCNSIMRRRSKGLFALENAITNPEKRKEFQEGKYSMVVAYDDQGGKLQTNENSAIKCKRILTMVLDVLDQNAPEATQIAYMNCGFKEFACVYPKRCQGCTRISLPALPLSEKMETPGTGTPGTGTPGTGTPGTGTPCTAFTPVYDQGAAVEILPHLYLGSAFHASQKEQLQTLGITAILNASSTCPNYFEDCFRYKRIPVEDNSQTDISLWFNGAISFINDIKEAGGKVLVHCHAGVSRSATICLAYLITCHNVTLSEAFRYVKNRRNVISPNFNFMGQLLKLETDVASRNSAAKIENQSRFDFASSRVEEMDCQEENLSKIEKKISLHTRHFAKPLASMDNRQPLVDQHNTKMCLTAPPRSKEFNFFGESNYSCSQQNSFLDSHVKRHSRTLTLST